MDPEIERLQVEVAALWKAHNSLADQLHRYEEWLGTVCSFPWKRIWWWICGWRFYRLGRWYGKGN